MKTAVIYARVSSVGDRQSTTRQVEDLKRYISFNDMELINIYEEKMSGAKENRPILTECIEFCIKNHVNTLCVSEISRLGRSVKIVVNTIDQLTKSGVNIYIQNIQLSTLDSEGQPNAIAKMITAVLSSFSEIERDGIVYRLQSGRRVAIEQRKVKLGRKVGSVKSRERKQEEYSKVIRSLKAGKSIRDTAAICGVSVSTVQRVKKEFAI
ncbi:MAG: recombinase family protein [Alistipes sp.]|nr:recombinase family protein [Alistipes sp.]MBP3643490.1 recombinase family protein [Alistipes sp.]MBQ7310142.1 recombinase family protein [Alistipes sp.]